MFAEATGRSAQFAALHFHGPVWVSNVVDVIHYPKSAFQQPGLLEGKSTDA